MDENEKDKELNYQYLGQTDQQQQNIFVKQNIRSENIQGQVYKEQNFARSILSSNNHQNKDLHQFKTFADTFNGDDDAEMANQME